MYNPFSLEGKTILVAGAFSGIGRAVAIECSRLGASVHILGHEEGMLLETLSHMEKGNHVFHVCDISDEDKLDQLMDSLPVFDGFSCCEGITRTMLVKFLNRKVLNEILDYNAVAPIMLTQKLVKKKKFNKKSSIVFTSSLAGVYTVHYGDSLNAISSGTINAFAKSAALDLSVQGIRVNCVNPGVVAMESVFSGTILTEEELAEKQKYFPLRRFGRPEDIAMAIVYLLSDASSWITGVSLPIDGGYTLL
ncbi:MAG: SDR family oxidoreductase [Prevotella sp.]|nr:SDR family oxidoreductase [Prevotella sp.]